MRLIVDLGVCPQGDRLPVALVGERNKERGENRKQQQKEEEENVKEKKGGKQKKI